MCGGFDDQMRELWIVNTQVDGRIWFIDKAK